MTIFKCKICGGALEVTEGASIVTCEYCGTKQTLPRLDDERRANLYDRAGHFRRNSDFDRAAGIYNQILNEDPSDAEAYWSLVLCRYGVEYVKDPTTGKHVPTVNRAQYTSIFDDEDYKAAIANADGYQREIYEAEASTINDIQKGILEISQKEEPFDVFVCYKESDKNGRRTEDSVLAAELYRELTREGFRVFYARVTLEDKLGAAYEPYIFAALHSAKVMVVLGTDPANFNAVWVKNEWSRYLALIKNGARKLLIPAYRDMDPYYLPEEFSHLQAQDMSRLGFMQDLIHAIGKAVEGKKAPTASAAPAPASVTDKAPVQPSTELILKRIRLFLEDGKPDAANDYCERLLDGDPENAEVYLAKLMIDLRVTQRDAIAQCGIDFSINPNYQKALRFAPPELARVLEDYVPLSKYNAAVFHMGTAENTEEFAHVISLLEELGDYKDAAKLREECREKIKGILYDKALARIKSAKNEKKIALSIALYDEAIIHLSNLKDFSDAKELIATCKNEINVLKKRNKKITLIKTLSVAAVILLICIGIGLGSFMSAPTIDGVRYKKEENGYHVTGYTSDIEEITVIPETLFGTPVTEIRTSAFKNCSTLKSITIPSTITTIYGDSFSDCRNLTEINYHAIDAEINGKTSSYYNTFAVFGNAGKDSTGITVNIGESVNKIPSYLFYAIGGFDHEIAPKIIKVVFAPNSKCRYIADYAFESSVDISEVHVDSLETWCNISFESGSSNPLGASGKLYVNGAELPSHLVLPEGITQIPLLAFYNCESITSVTIPSSVTSIGACAFQDCFNLENISFSGDSQLNYIDDCAFEGCSKLDTIILPRKVSFINPWAFCGCTSLRYAIFHNPSGWVYKKNSTSESGESFSYTQLSNPSIAATYLKSTYCDYYWVRK